MSVFKSLEENEPTVYVEVTEILLKVLDNIIKNPTNAKYRKLRLSNEIVSSKLIPAIGALECLFAFGFDEGDDSLILSIDFPLYKLKAQREELDKCRKEFLKKSVSCSQPVLQSLSPLFIEMKSLSEHVQCYEDVQLQEAARNVIPNEFIKLSQNYDSFEDEFGLIFRLLRWFKEDFFQWMDTPVCKRCNVPSTFQGLSTNTEGVKNVDRVEVYHCNRCKERLTFPRYNNPAILLKTRTGRCGEWANCFTLICKSVGYDVRYIFDKTDHVWTEVYSRNLQRWIHCDPCENVIDKPLIYEKGWKKQLSYVLAFSSEEVQDVTWRYTSEFDIVRKRRNLCREQDLLRFILQLSNRLQSSLPEERKKLLLKRRIAECVEFLTPPKEDNECYEGRTSGSLQWRLSRNECRMENISTVWKLSQVEKERKRFCMRYSTASDTYHRFESNETIKGWQYGIFESETIFRKVEHDWKVCYLCREEGAAMGTVKWKFDFENEDLIIENVLIRYKCDTFHDGSARLILCNDETCLPLPTDKCSINTNMFDGSTNITLTAVLSGGAGSVAWQHSQLFRQPLDEKTNYPFEVTISFKGK